MTILSTTYDVVYLMKENRIHIKTISCITIIHKILKPSLVLRHMKNQIYEILARHTLSYRIKEWTMRVNER
jgi:hypothetical protein